MDINFEIAGPHQLGIFMFVDINYQIYIYKSISYSNYDDSLRTALVG